MAGVPGQADHGRAHAHRGAGDDGRRRRREAAAEGDRAGELPDRPALLQGGAAQTPVRVDRGGVADGRQHRQVGDRVAVGVAVGEVVAVLLGDLAHRRGLVLAVGVVVDLTGVAPVGDHHAGGHDAVGPEHGPDRLDDLRPTARDDHDLAAGGAVLLDQVRGLGVDERVDDVVQRLPDDVVHRRDVPAGAHGRDLRPETLHLLGVGAGEGEDELRVRGLQRGTPVDQPALEERAAEGQGAGLGDDRLVQIEERRGAGHSSRG